MIIRGEHEQGEQEHKKGKNKKKTVKESDINKNKTIVQPEFLSSFHIG